MIRKDLHEENRLAWNEATHAHNSHKADQARFLREGGSTLFPEETKLLGDIQGLSLVHLQCNSGQDSLSLAQAGAHVTGVDISDTAIAFARALAQESGIPATFVRRDIYDWFEDAARGGKSYDIVFCSYGVVWWLSDLRAWARGIAGVLNPGGRFILVDFHPVVMTFNSQWMHTYPYFSAGHIVTRKMGVTDYVVRCKALAHSGFVEGMKDFQNPHRCHQFIWGIGEILSTLLEVGLTITTFEEYPYFNGCSVFEGMREGPGKRLFPPDQVPNLPLMYGIVMQKV